MTMIMPTNSFYPYLILILSLLITIYSNRSLSSTSPILPVYFQSLLSNTTLQISISPICLTPPQNTISPSHIPIILPFYKTILTFIIPDIFKINPKKIYETTRFSIQILTLLLIITLLRQANNCKYKSNLTTNSINL